MPELHPELLASETFYNKNTIDAAHYAVFGTCLFNYFIIVPPFLFSSFFTGTDISIRLVSTYQVMAAYINIIRKTQAILYEGLEANFDYADRVAARKDRKFALMTPEERLQVKIQLKEGTYVEKRTEKEIEDDEKEDRKEQERIEEMKTLVGDLVNNFRDEFIIFHMTTQDPLRIINFLEERVIRILAAFKYVRKEDSLTYEQHVDKLQRLKTTSLVRVKKGRCVEDMYEQVVENNEKANGFRRSNIENMLKVEGLPEKQVKRLYIYLNSR
jgi:hypothetical protein